MIKKIIGAVWFTGWLSVTVPTSAAPSGAASPPGSKTGEANAARAEVVGRSWTSRDSIAVRYFDPEAIEISPDGSHFFFVNFHGDLSCDCRVYELSVYATEDLRNGLVGAGSAREIAAKPLRRLIRRSYGNEAFAVISAHWERDGESVSFQGVSEQGISQLYRFDVRSGTITALTNETHEVYAMWHVGGTNISDVFVPTAAAPPVYPVHAITHSELRDALLPPKRKERVMTFVSYRGGTPWEVQSTDVDPEFPPFFSSDGRKAVALRLPKEVPASWYAYDELSRLSDYGGAEKPVFPQFVLIDAEHGRSEPMFDAPSGFATRVGTDRARTTGLQALWAEDQRHVVLVDTALPITPGQSPERTGMAYIVGYDADSGQWAVIEPLESHDGAGRVLRDVTEVGWLKSGKELLIGHEESGRPAHGTVYRLKGDRWIGRTVAATVKLPAPPAPPALSGGLSVTLRQGANQPPVMVASDGHHELALTEPDPALEGVWWARSEPFQWREPGGKTSTGGLLLPRESKAPVPLVIQAYVYEPDQFEPDGPYQSAYAAQSLVARGMAVLTVNIPTEDVPRESNTPRELTEFAQRVDSAADALADRGVIDRARVGLIGFSRGGYNTYYAITHPGKFPLAAAVVDDSFTGSYANYLLMQSVDPLGAVAFDEVYGSTFWQNKSAWLERETTFNVDRVETPALFALHSEITIAYAIDTIGAFELNHRPLEYLMFPDARHVLHIPRQRLASLEASTDWMSFWLQGYADPSPEKASQYARWRTLREQNEQRKAGQRSAAPH